jgi:hypothetical protein
MIFLLYDSQTRIHTHNIVPYGLWVFCAKKKIPSDHLEFKKVYTHLQYNIVNRRDPYSAIVIKSPL